VTVNFTLAAWAVLEVVVRVWEWVQGRGRGDRDRATRVLIALSLGAAIAIAAVLRERTWAIGVVVMWVGLAVRVWAVATLGRSFRTTIEVDTDQPVISTGPYRWVRHPSYTGLLLIVAGFGLTTGNWLSFLAGLVVPLPAVVRRIRLEEAELDRVLGAAYRTYASGRARLIPRLW
jgi:protein-S-isoprenylcysteine O-methyltransferase Ste14